MGLGASRAIAIASCVGIAIAAATSMAARTQEQAAAPPLSFNRDILPILSNNCFACHGPDEKQRKTRFHFDTREGAFAKAGVIVPGHAAGSVLIERITNQDPLRRMPPPESLYCPVSV